MANTAIGAESKKKAHTITFKDEAHEEFYKNWIVNTFLDNFFKGVFFVFYRCHVVERRMNPMIIKPVYII